MKGLYLANALRWLAVIAPHNLAPLEKLGHPFFALRSRNKSATQISAGDSIVLYRSRGTGARAKPGIIGLFEVTGELFESNEPTFGRKLYPIRIPWRAVLLSLNEPVPLKNLVNDLRFIVDKKNYGASMQITLKRLDERDFIVIKEALSNQVASFIPRAAEAVKFKE